MPTVIRRVLLSTLACVVFPAHVAFAQSYGESFNQPKPRGATTEQESRTFWERLLDREPETLQGTGLFERLGRQAPKSLTVPEDTINSLKLQAQGWVLEMREKTAEIKQVGDGVYIKEFNSFSDRYTIEIERAPEEEEDATFYGYIFLDSTHMRTGTHDSVTAAEADTQYSEEERKIRMLYKLVEAWEYSDMAEEFVFNRRWELARVQFKEREEFSGVRQRPQPVPIPEVEAPAPTPRAAAE